MCFQSAYFLTTGEVQKSTKQIMMWHSRNWRLKKLYTKFQTTVTWEWAQVLLRFVMVSKCVFTLRPSEQLTWILVLFKYSTHITKNYSSWTIWRIGSERGSPSLQNIFGGHPAFQPVGTGDFSAGLMWLDHEADSSATPSTKVWGYIFMLRNNNVWM